MKRTVDYTAHVPRKTPRTPRTRRRFDGARNASSPHVKRALTHLLVATGVAALGSTGPLAAVGKPVTLAGCVRAGSTPDSFGLWNVEEISAGIAVPAGAMYRLSSITGLRDHIGHKVEVRGTYVLAIDPERSTKGKSDSTRPSIDAPKAVATSGSIEELAGPYRHLTVSSIRLIASSCQVER